VYVMDLQSIAKWIENGAIGTWIRESTYAFPTIETIHVLAIVTVVGSVTMLDLRLLNLASRERPVSEVMSDVLPWTWWSFVTAAITGSLLFTSKAAEYYSDFPFRMKMLMLVLAGINMGVFEFRMVPGMSTWDREEKTPVGARVAGGISLVIWICVVAFGRWIGFTTS